MPLKLARIISFILNPLLMPTAVFAVLFAFSPAAVSLPGFKLKMIFLISIFAFTFLVPLVSVFTFGLASTKGYQMQERRDRVVPFVFVSLFYIIVSYFFIHKLDLSPTLSVVFIAITLSIIITTVVTLFWKISVHSVGVSGAVGLILAFAYKFPESNLLIPLVIAIICCGLAMSARLSLNCHSRSQVYAGCAVGFGVCFLSVVLFG